MVEGYLDFEFDLPGHLIKSLIDKFDNVIMAAPLSIGGLSGIPNEQGLYQLLYKGEVVYIGKTEGGKGLSGRLKKHLKRIQHRKNISVGDVTFKAVRVFVFTAMDLEKPLINHYLSDLSWNNKGFGPNDPGHNRDMTRGRDQQDGFDDNFPIDTDLLIDISDLSGRPIYECLNELGDAVPYVVRYQKQTNGRNDRRPHPDLLNSTGSLPSIGTTARDYVKAVMVSVGDGWQAVALSGRIIVYKDNELYPGENLYP